MSLALMTVKSLYGWFLRMMVLKTAHGDDAFECSILTRDKVAEDLISAIDLS